MALFTTLKHFLHATLDGIITRQSPHEWSVNLNARSNVYPVSHKLSRPTITQTPVHRHVHCTLQNE